MLPMNDIAEGYENTNVVFTLYGRDGKIMGNCMANGVNTIGMLAGMKIDPESVPEICFISNLSAGSILEIVESVAAKRNAAAVPSSNPIDVRSLEDGEAVRVVSGYPVGDPGNLKMASISGRKMGMVEIGPRNTLFVVFLLSGDDCIVAVPWVTTAVAKDHATS